jgi:hypothetical protein
MHEQNKEEYRKEQKRYILDQIYKIVLDILSLFDRQFLHM